MNRVTVYVILMITAIAFPSGSKAADSAATCRRISSQTGLFESVQLFNQLTDSERRDVQILFDEPDYSVVLNRLEPLWNRLGDRLYLLEGGWAVPVRAVLGTGRNRPLTDQELRLYRERFDVQADSLLRTGLESNSVERSEAVWRQVIDWYPAATVSPALADQLAESYYCRGDYIRAIGLWNRLIPAPLFPLPVPDKLAERGRQSNARSSETSAAYLSGAVGLKIPRSEQLKSSDAEIEARIAWAWLCWSRSDPSESANYALGQRGDDFFASQFKNKYGQTSGRMAGKTVVLSDFLMQGRPPLATNEAGTNATGTNDAGTNEAGTVQSAAGVAADSFVIGSQGISKREGQKSELIYDDERPDALRRLDLPAAFHELGKAGEAGNSGELRGIGESSKLSKLNKSSKSGEPGESGVAVIGESGRQAKIEPTNNRLYPYREIDGTVFARTGTPIVGQNLNRRTPDGLTNRLVCLDTKRTNTVRWEREPKNASFRWTGAGLFYRSRLYVLEFQSGFPAQLFVSCLDSASGAVLWRRFIASGTALSGGEKELVGSLDLENQDSTLPLQLSRDCRVWLCPETGAILLYEAQSTTMRRAESRPVSERGEFGERGEK